MTIRMPRALALIAVGLVVGLSVTLFPAQEHPGMDAPATSLDGNQRTPPAEPARVENPAPGTNDSPQSSQLSTAPEPHKPSEQADEQHPAQPMAETGTNDGPATDIHFNLNLDESTHHMIRGEGSTDTSAFVFESKRLPSNEVELAIILEQEQQEDIVLKAHFDLARFTMELDGGGGILNGEHKQALRLAASKLQNDFRAQYEGYDLPEHALMLSQMMAYWSVSPEGYAHEKRAIVSR